MSALLQSFKKHYGSLEVSRDKIVISKCEPHVAIALKNIFPKIPSYSKAPFSFERTTENAADLLWFMDRYPLKMEQKSKGILTRLKAQFKKDLNEMEKILLPDYKAREFDYLKPSQRVRNYQAQAVEMFWKKGYLLLGDDLGLGKTYSALASCMCSTKLPAIMVVQTHLPQQWYEKATEFSNLRVHVIQTRRPYNLPAADIYIAKYSIISGWVDVFAEGLFKLVTFDEAQELRTGDGTAKGAAAKVLCEHAKYRLALSASPIYNYADELWRIYDIIRGNELHPLGSLDEFKREWCSGFSNIVDDPKALGSYLREKHVFLRRLKKDVGQELAPINKIVETIDYDESTVKAIEKLAIELAVTITSGEFAERGQAARELDLKLRQVTGIAKAKSVAQYVKILLDNNIPVLLTGWHREVYRIWESMLCEYNPLFYTGTETPKQKQEAVDAFMNGESNLLIMSIRSAAGVDGLQHRCSVVVHGELDWSPEAHKQADGRVYREGQKEQVMTIYLVANGGSDPVMVNLLGLKSSQASGIIDGELGVQKVNSDKSRIKYLAEEYLKMHNVRIPEKSKEVAGKPANNNTRGQLSFNV